MLYENMPELLPPPRPLHDAIESGSLEMVCLLIQHGADPLAEFGDHTPMEFARNEGQEEICSYLQGVRV